MNYPIFIMGSGRCGTLWMSEWLDLHPQCFAVPEIRIYNQLKFFHDAESKWLKVNEESVLSSYRDFVLRVYEIRKPCDENKIHCVDHTPNNYRMLEFIRRIFPSSPVLMMYRDGKSVVHSFKTRSFASHLTIRQICHTWLEAMNVIIHNRDPQVLVLKYEDLLVDSSFSRRITEFIGLEHHCDLEPWKTPTHHTANTKYSPREWTKRPPEDLQVMQLLLNPMLERFGYETI